MGDDQRHGYFTAALLEKLEDPAATFVDALTLKNYVVKRVAELTGQRQKPEMPVDDNIVLRAGPTTAAYRVRILFPAGYAGEVELCRGLSDVIARQTASSEPWTVELADELYRVRPADADEPGFDNGGAFAVEGSDRDVQL